MAITALFALIFSYFYFNKRLKIYYYTENNNLKIIYFDKGNNNCKMEKVIYTVNGTTFEETSMVDNECSICLDYFDHKMAINILVLDNFGRKYKFTYKTR